jgi:hypothetical protein
MVSAELRSFWPGEMRLIAAVDGTSTWRASPVSGFTVRVVPSMAVIVPRKREGACAAAVGVTESEAADKAMVSANGTFKRELLNLILLFISLFSTGNFL